MATADPHRQLQQRQAARRQHKVQRTEDQRLRLKEQAEVMRASIEQQRLEVQDRAERETATHTAAAERLDRLQETLADPGSERVDLAAAQDDLRKVSLETGVVLPPVARVPFRPLVPRVTPREEIDKYEPGAPVPEAKVRSYLAGQYLDRPKPRTKLHARLDQLFAASVLAASPPPRSSSPTPPDTGAEPPADGGDDRERLRELIDHVFRSQGGSPKDAAAVFDALVRGGVDSPDELAGTALLQRPSKVTMVNNLIGRLQLSDADRRLLQEHATELQGTIRAAKSER